MSAVRSPVCSSTIGSCTTKPGIVTSVVEECRITLDQRHLANDAPAQIVPKGRKGRVQRPWLIVRSVHRRSVQEMHGF